MLLIVQLQVRAAGLESRSERRAVRQASVDSRGHSRDPSFCTYRTWWHPWGGRLWPGRWVLATAAAGRRQRARLWARTVPEGVVGWSEGCPTVRIVLPHLCGVASLPAELGAWSCRSCALLVPEGAKLWAPSDILPTDPQSLPAPRAASESTPGESTACGPSACVGWPMFRTGGDYIETALCRPLLKSLSSTLIPLWATRDT
jgi:hypothetical protein